MVDNTHQWLDKVAHGTGKDLLRFLRSRLSNASDAEDLAQEVYMRLLRVKDTSKIENQRAYVLRVASNVAYEWRLLARNRMPHSSEPLETMVDKADPVHEVNIGRQIKTLEAALEMLVPKCRAVLLMHRRDRYTYKEIAQRMDISVSMVKKYLVKGLSVCQQHLIKENDNQDIDSGGTTKP